MHRLLRRQVRKHLPPEFRDQPGLAAFLDAVDDAYEQYDADRRILERSMEISSTELLEANERLQDESRRKEVILTSLKSSLQALQPDAMAKVGDEDLHSISELLQEQIERRNQAEEALREREQRLKLIIESTSDYAIFTLDREGRISSWNEGARRMVGYDADEVLGERLDMFYADGATGPHGTDELHEAALTGSCVAQGWRRRKDGSLLWVESTLSALRDDSGQLTGFVRIARDMTDRRRNEEALRKTRDAAESASRAKSMFLANMSHEIRTPMNAVIGMTGLLEGTPLDEEQLEMVQTIQSSGNALLSLINDILDLSKIEAGKLTLSQTPFDFRASVEKTLDVFRPLIDQDRIALSLEWDPATPIRVASDEARIRQVLFNLLGNAVKFTKAGTIRARVGSKARDNRIWYHVAVQDTGVGIASDALSSLFKPFSQVESDSGLRPDGTGLGLAITKRLVEALGGEIWVESTPGVGSTFHFTFVTEVTEQLRAAPAAVPDREPVRATRGLSVLVAEDNPTNQLVITRLLQRVGQKADIVSTGNEAVDSVRKGRYDVVFMDVQMPEMDGLEATAAIRMLDVPQPVIIALTANAMAEDRVRCLEAGMDQYLSKPVLADDLRTALARVRSFKSSGTPTASEA